jgi:NAD(P)-dependent dehydrogenase (short-subunit alcohol dehydrogenase family)
MTRTWFITGAGRGFGKEFAKAALSRGDKVAATARNTDALGDLVAANGDAILPLTLDVTDREEASAAVTQARKALGPLDVIVNNAGYGLFGAVEEITPEQLQQQLDVNLFGPFHVMQAALPILRGQGHGHIIQVSTVSGVAAFPILGGYHASKWALEGLTEALAQEVAGFGIKVTLVARRLCHRLGGASAKWADALPEYQQVKEAVFATGGGSRTTPHTSAKRSSPWRMPPTRRRVSSSAAMASSSSSRSTRSA